MKQQPTAENLHIDVQVLDSWQPNENERYEIRTINGNLWIEYQNIKHQFVEWVEADNVDALNESLGPEIFNNIMQGILERTAFLAASLHGTQPAKETP